MLDFLRELQNEQFMRTSQDVQLDLQLGLQLGAYAYDKKFLKEYANHHSSKREINESHEMLRILPLPSISVILTVQKSLSIDTIDDLEEMKNKFVESKSIN